MGHFPIVNVLTFDLTCDAFAKEFKKLFVSESNNGAIIAGAVIGGLVAIALIGAAVFYCSRNSTSVSKLGKCVESVKPNQKDGKQTVIGI